jgi:hypothetical protein
MRIRPVSLACISALFIAAACSSRTSPTSPSPTEGATTGATISGSIVSGSGGAMANGTGVTVSVAGTPFSTVTDANGRFGFSRVPPGDVQLRFISSGADATLTVPGVVNEETIDMSLSLQGSSATVERVSRSAGAVNVNGRMSGLSGTILRFAFTVEGRTVRGDSTTEFFGNSVFADLANGREVEVKGVEAGGVVFAVRIHVNGTDDDSQQESASIEGTLTARSGVEPLLTLVVDGTTVRTSASTVVRRRGDVQTLATLQTGMLVHVEGIRRSDRSIDARMVQIKDDEVGDVMEIAGSLGGLQGVCPVVSFGVNGYKVQTNAATTFELACASLKSGTKVDVTGIRQADGGILATRVRKND